MARSYVQVNPDSKYVSFQFVCSCGTASTTCQTHDQAESARQNHMKRHEPAPKGEGLRLWRKR